MAINFVNPRSGVNYGFTELRVENLSDLSSDAALVHVQVSQKRIDGFTVAVNPRPPNDNYFLTVRTP
jgi:hypothetical protein